MLPCSHIIITIVLLIHPLNLCHQPFTVHEFREVDPISLCFNANLNSFRPLQIFPPTPWSTPTTYDRRDDDILVVILRCDDNCNQLIQMQSLFYQTAPLF